MGFILRNSGDLFDTPISKFLTSSTLTPLYSAAMSALKAFLLLLPACKTYNKTKCLFHWRNIFSTSRFTNWNSCLILVIVITNNIESLGKNHIDQLYKYRINEPNSYSIQCLLKIYSLQFNGEDPNRNNSEPPSAWGKVSIQMNRQCKCKIIQGLGTNQSDDRFWDKFFTAARAKALIFIDFH